MGAGQQSTSHVLPAVGNVQHIGCDGGFFPLPPQRSGIIASTPHNNTVRTGHFSFCTPDVRDRSTVTSPSARSASSAMLNTSYQHTDYSVRRPFCQVATMFDVFVSLTLSMKTPLG